MIKFFYFNLIDQDVTSITSSNENALFPASNLKDKRSTKVYRSTTATDSIVFDFITTEPVDSIIIRGHALEGIKFNGSLTIEANPTNLWTSPAFSTTITPNSEFNFGHKTITEQNYRFWRVTGTGSSYFELADMFIGKFFSPGKNINFNWSFDNNDKSKFTSNRYGQKFIDEINDQKKINGSINLLTSAEQKLVSDFFDYVGKKRPFYAVLDELEEFSSNKELFSGKYHFRSKPSFTNIAFSLYNTNISMEEEP